MNNNIISDRPLNIEDVPASIGNYSCYSDVKYSSISDPFFIRCQDLYFDCLTGTSREITDLLDEGAGYEWIPLIIDEENVVIDGYHRFFALLAGKYGIVFGEDFKVEVQRIKE